VWCIEHAHRAAVLVDAADFFLAVRQALLKARRSVYIIGWDISSRTRLVGPSGRADDGWPEMLVDFLVRLVKERPSLEVNILIWDYSLIYVPEREWLPALSLGWTTPRQIKFRADNDLPIGSAQHQKIIVIDDAIAMTGGLDLTIRRWDTSAHRIDEHARVDPRGSPYRPFHDVQLLVDGPAAQALAALARARWENTWDRQAPAIAPLGDPWPDGIKPDFTEISVGIARTLPSSDTQPGIREVEKLFHDSIEAAERTIYIENQFLSALSVADRLVARLRARPDLEVLMVTSEIHESWLEERAMRPAVARFMRRLREAECAERARIVCPEVSDSQRSVWTTVHSKVMVVDDRLLRVGSANLNNRSMGTDTECDLAIEADGCGSGDITRIRDRLVADHCGVSPEAVAGAIAHSKSLLHAAETLSCGGHRLRPMDESLMLASDTPIRIDSIADPEEPLGAEEFMSAILGARPYRLRLSKMTKLIAAVLFLVLLSFAWTYAPLGRLADPEYLQPALHTLAASPFAPLLIIGGFLVLELLAFPITILIAATAAAFGPWLGFIYAASGTLCSAIVTYAIGALLGKDILRDVLGRRMQAIRRAIEQQGMLTIAAIRLVPIAPFAVINVAAGALQVRFLDFIGGTVIGMAPGLLLMSALGHQAMQILLEPTLPSILLLATCILAWIAIAVGAQMAIARYKKSTS